MASGSDRERSRWKRYWRALTSGRGVDDELAFHVEMRTRDLIAQGMTPAAAGREAARRFGDTARIRRSLEQIERQRGRRVRWGMWFDEVGQDIRYGIRGLLKRPGFALAATLSLAIGLATVTVVYSLVDAYLIRPLPVASPEELVVIGSRVPGPPVTTTDAISYPTYLALRNRHDLFIDVAGFSGPGVTIRTSDEANGEQGIVFAVTGSYFPMLGIRPQLGRLLAEDDDRRRTPALVLADGYWRRRFGADPAVVGRTARLNGAVFTIVGIAPPQFTGTLQVFSPEGFVPRSLVGTLYPAAAGLDDRSDLSGVSLDLIARKQPGISLGQLRAGLENVSRDLERQFPKENQGLRLVVYPEHRARPSIHAAEIMPLIAAVFMGLAVLVLAVACANVANLVLVRIASRRNELAVRQALGASRGRVVRQLLTESVVLGAGGLLLGWWFAWNGIRWMAQLELASDLKFHLTVTPDWRVLGFAGAVAIAAGILVGFVPALAVTRTGPRGVVSAGARTIGGGSRHRGFLVTAQLAVSMVALVAAGLFARSVQHAAKIDLGFDPSRVVKAGLAPNLAGYDDARGRVVVERVIDRIRALPGVRRAAWATAVPLQTTGLALIDAYFDRPIGSKDDRDHVAVLANAISGEYFDVMGIRLRAGRTFTSRDDSLAPPVAIVNATAARAFWPGKDPIGQRFRTVRDGPLIEVVGVAPDGRYLFVSEPPRPYLYLAITQQRESGRVLLVQTASAPGGSVGDIRAAIAGVDPDLVPIGLETMTSHLRTSATFVLLRLAAVLASAIGLLTVIQASLGLYGVIAYSVAQRGREIGIRMALGAEPRGVLALVIGEGGRLIGAGLLTGAVAAVAVSRLLRGFLVGIGTLDLVAFGGSIGVLLGVGLLATYLPARRAARLDPIRALRSDG